MTRPDRNTEMNALLGKGSAFEGKLTFEGTVRIDGTFSGEINTEGCLVVGEGAEVDAQIDVDSIIVHGHVRGDIRAKTSIELRAPAVLRGNITAPSLVIDKGVVFDGNCRMEQVTTVAALPPRDERDHLVTPLRQNTPMAKAASVGGVSMNIGMSDNR